MRVATKIFYICFAVIFLLSTNSSESKEISATQKQVEFKKSKDASKEYAIAIRQAENNEPAGFLKLFEIATNDLTYTVEYSEVAHEQIILLLYSKPGLWVKTFAQIDLGKMKALIQDIEVTDLPKDALSDDQFKESIFNKLKKTKGNIKEKQLIDYLLSLK